MAEKCFSDFDPLLFEVVTVGSVPVYVKTVPYVTGWVEFRVIIHAGSVFDPAGRSGTAHFLEHLLFQGNEEWPDKARFEKRSKELLIGGLNAYTSSTGIIVEAKAFNDQLPDALRFLRAMLFSPTLTDREIDRERQVIVGEIREDMSTQRIADLVRLERINLYGNHPWNEASVLGTEETIAAITANDLRAFHQTYLHCGNLSLLFVGDINAAKAEKHAFDFLQGVEQDQIAIFPTIDNLTDGWKPRCTEMRVSFSSWLNLARPISQVSKIQVSTLLPDSVSDTEVDALTDCADELLLPIRHQQGLCYHIGFSSQALRTHWALKLSCEVPIGTDEQVIEQILESFKTLAIDDKIDGVFREVNDETIRIRSTPDLDVESIAMVGANKLCDFGAIPSAQALLDRSRALESKRISYLARRFLTRDRLLVRVLSP